MSEAIAPVSVAVHLADAAATGGCGAAMAPMLDGGMVVTLEGALGTGKTTLARALLRARGVEGPIKSPTFALVEHYPMSSLYFYHFDFYRFGRADEWDAAGMSEYFRNDAVCIVEWPERAGNRLPPADLALSLRYADDGGRDLVATASTVAGLRCVTALREAPPAN